ncbi:hypothetical protein F4677DRAFT_451366 [Hypoxylon crocopeplum]|nr:hypothetical protein F4677DRAFT_451366 [Hypoxylon crocopeplum]
MFFKTIIATAIAALFAGQVMGTATDPYAACNCPNNCSHQVNSSCKFYSGNSDNSDVVSGRCTSEGNYLVCIPN